MDLFLAVRAAAGAEAGAAGTAAGGAGRLVVPDRETQPPFPVTCSRGGAPHVLSAVP